MAKVDLIAREWCDMVFAGRNKEYGAYRIRANAGQRNLRAFLLLLAAIAAIGIGVFLNNKIQEAISANKEVGQEVTQLSQLKEEKKPEEKKIEQPKDEPKPEPQVEKVAVKASLEFTVPDITDDEKVTKQVKTQDEVSSSKATISFKDYAGDENAKTSMNELKEGQKEGGTTTPPKQEEILDNEIIEQQATFPGGEAALLAYVNKNVKYPSIALEQELQGTVLVRFVVQKDGSVGDVKVLKSLSKECDREAIRVVKSLPRFTPARMQGRAVPVYFKLPIRYMITS